MSTVAPRPPAPPIPPALLDSERYIDDHIRRTRRALKLTDLAAGVITLAVGLLGFLLAAALIDHWIIPGGLSPGARMTLFGALVAGVAWYGWRQFAPLVRSINPVYAAHAIEKSAPSLKNSLLNLLLFRGHRQGMSARVYHALEQQAAQRLSTASTDGAIDRAALLRLGYALVAVIAACALYGVLSPKNLATSAARILAPLADIAAPSRVKILNIEPGDASVARGERVAISADIRGAAADEPVRLRYSTADEQVVDETVVMTTPAVDAGGRFSAELPRASAVGRAVGVMQDIEYWIEAGDARSRRFRLSVFQRPTIVVQRLRYEYPAYTGEPSKTVDNVGDIRALEGTRVTVEALANQPIKSAHVDFDGDGTSDLAMRVDGDRAYATFELGLRPDRRTPLHASYVLRFTTTAGRTNSEPAQYRIEVTPDYAPEVRIMTPEDPELSVRRDQTVLINVEARDPDYAVQRVRLVGRAGERDVELGELLSRDHPGRFSGTKPFVPGDVQLVAGDVLEYWAEAVDNRRPEANVTVSERRRLRIVDPDAAENPDRGPGGGESPQAEGGEGGDAGQPGEAGEGEDQQPGEGGADGESGGEEGQSGAGAPGGGEGGEQSEQSESGEGQPSASGGESGENSSAEGAAGAEGGNAGAEGDESTQPTEGAGGGDQREPSVEEGADAEAGAGGGEEGGAPSERVSTEGDDDSTAFDRIRERFAEQDAASRAEDAGGEGAEEAGESADTGEEQSATDPQPGAEGETQGEATGERRDPSGAEAPSDGDAGEGEPREGDAPSEGESGEQPAGQPGDTGSPGERPADQQGTSETPAGADGANNPSNGGAPAGDDEGGEPGAPEASNKDPGEDSDAADEGESGTEGDAATADSKGDQESDASGDTGGDRSGAGQPGAGQQADNPGEGEAGSHEDADTGAGASSQPGAGETGTGPGEEQTADGETGESSGDQPGEGSQLRETAGEGETGGGQPEGDPTGGETPGGEQPGDDPGAGEQPVGAGEESGGEQPSGAGADGQSGEAGEPSATGEQPSGDSPPSDGAAGEPSDPEEAPEGGGSSGGASSTPPTSGGNGQGGVDGTSPGGEPGGDDANLEFAREQTDLMLERLDDQLADQQVDAELLRRLGWTEDELQQFVARWREFQARAAADDSGESQQELDAALRSLGLRPTGPLGIRPGVDADDLRDLNDAARKRAPLEYLDRVRWYMKGATAGDAE